MKVEALYTRSFRNLVEQEVPFAPGVNCLVGKTGHGKTSFLEALSLLIVGSSFRTHLLREAIAFDQPSFYVQAVLEASGVRKSLALGYDGTKRHVSINNRPCSSTKELLGSLLGVTSGLFDIELLTQAPFLRRKYLDEQIAEVDSFFVEQLCKANRALQQRNMLLRTSQTASIEVWEEILAVSAAYIITQRRNTAHELIPFIDEWLDHFSSLSHIKKHLDIRFKTQLPIDETDPVSWLRQQLEAKRAKEREYKTTLIGHHRDDLVLLHKGLPLKQTLSLGQLRLVALAIRLAEWSLLKKRALGPTPLFLLDDIDGTLDARSKELIHHVFPLLSQVIMTSHEETTCPREARIIFIENGRLQSEND